GSDSAAKAALYLNQIAEKVYIVYRKDKLRCEPILLERIKKSDIEVIYNSQPKAIQGNEKVEKLILDNSSLDIDGIFIEIGSIPNTELVKNLVKLDQYGQIITDKQAQTSQQGIFAAGDATNNSLKQAITAAGEGAIAAKSAYDFLAL
ncbi:MAG: NAD(P)/FAD-dependent oxidoreductase, partial [Candidatus Nanoarchaeia archaeon]